MRYQTSPRSRRSGFSLGLILTLLAALAVGIVIGVLISGDDDAAVGGSPAPGASGSAASTATPVIAGSAGASAQPPGPSPVVAAPTDVLPPGSVARVVIDGLRVRESPTTSAEQVGQLPLGRLLMVQTFGPVNADAFAWYPVRLIGELTELPALPEPLPEGGTGWVAFGDGTAPYLELVAPRCPARPVDLEALAAMVPWEHLACFGGESITVEGVFGCGGCGGSYAGTFVPPWLTHPVNGNFLSPDPNERIGPFAMRFRPEGPELPAAGSIIRVTGHFDDAAAQGCTVAPGDPPVPAHATTAALYCRQQFAVDALEVLGTDPDFPLG